MTKSRLNRAVSKTVTLDSGRFGTMLTITPSGSVAPSAYGDEGVVALVAGVVLVNHGTVQGSVGSYDANGNGGAGGVGVDFSAGGTITNAGLVAGGAGGLGGFRYDDGAAGDGVDIAGGRLSNSGTITGGGLPLHSDIAAGNGVVFAAEGEIVNSGAISGGYGGTIAGGVGVTFQSGGHITNTGLILGGGGGYFSAAGGAGVDLGTAQLANAGTILGGSGGGIYRGTGGVGGAGVEVTTGRLSNTGTIHGGVGFTFTELYNAGGTGGVGIDVTGAGSVTNHGAIIGGTGGAAGEYAVAGVGGNGVDFQAGTILINTGAIAGGTGGAGGGGGGPPGGNGGAGVYLDGGTVLNSGSISGGATGDSFRSGGAGGTGVDVASGKLSNTGTIHGGAGYIYGSQYDNGGPGGVGVSVAGPGSVINDGVVLGGNGGAANRQGGNGGNGGNVLAGGILTNTGTIAGGTGGLSRSEGDSHDGNGGTGVYIDGGTLIDSGVISGGSSPVPGGMAGDAVQFGQLAATLQIEAGAIFSGDIIANAAVDDALILAGSAAGALAGFGTSVTGFTTIVEKTHANWTLAGTISNPGVGLGTITLDSSASLTLTGAVQIASIAFGANDRLSLGAPTELTSVLSGFGRGDTIDLSGIQAGSLSYAGGTLTLYGPDQHVVDTLAFSGDYATGDFGLKPDGAGGTDIVFTGTPEANQSVGGLARDPTADHAGLPVMASWHALPLGG